MDPQAFYRLEGPTEWPSPPATYSFSSLRELAVCPRRWQLTHGRYLELDRLPEPPGEAAEVGVLVHELLSKILNTLVMHGLPEQGSGAFAAAMASLDLHACVRKAIEEAHARIHGHPRAATVRWRLSMADVLNRVLHQFQLTYPQVRSAGPAPAPVRTKTAGTGGPVSLSALLLSRGLLSEEHLSHPSLPLHGFLDLVHTGEGGAVIVDFKTGAKHDEHRDQLELYALLWWRTTGEMPRELVVRYVDHAERWSVTQAHLEQVEKALAAKVAVLGAALAIQPAEARGGEQCRRCPGRAFCAAYWTAPTLEGVSALMDVELTVQKTTDYSATGSTGAGETVTVVWEDDVQHSQRPAVAERVRLLGVVKTKEKNVVKLRPATEVFRRLAQDQSPRAG